MNVEFANIFIQSAVSVFRQEVKVNLTRKDLVKKTSPLPGRPIAIIIGVTGYLRGQIVYSMDAECALGIARAMMPNKLPLEVKKLVNSAVSEIANMITGQATIGLAGEKAIIDLTPPVVLMASDLKLDFMQVPTISLNMISEIGVLEINIALVEPENSGA